MGFLVVEDVRFQPTEGDMELAARVDASIPTLIGTFDWRASRAHWRILDGLNKPETLVGVAYFARGCWNAPNGEELLDGPRRLGESHMDSVRRFCDLQLATMLPVEEALARNATAAELAKLVCQHRMKAPSHKAELVSLVASALPDDSRAIAARKDWFVMTERGAFLLDKGREKVVAGALRTLINLLRSALMEQDIEKALRIHIDINSVVDTRRTLAPRIACDLRMVLTREWPDQLVVIGVGLLPTQLTHAQSEDRAIRAGMGMSVLLAFAALTALGWEQVEWGAVGVTQSPLEGDEPIGPGHLARIFTAEFQRPPSYA